MTFPTAEEITSQWGEKCLDFEAECPCCQIWTMHDEIERLTDKVEGLSADLDGAVEVAFKHGANDWVHLNYPYHFARLCALVKSPTPA